MNCYYGRHQNYSGQYLTMETLLKTITHVIKQCQGITILKKIKSYYCTNSGCYFLLFWSTVSTSVFDIYLLLEYFII